MKLVGTVPAGVAALKLEEQAFGLREQSLQSTLDLLQSPELMRRVVLGAQLRLKPEEVAARSRISASSPKDLITITYQGSSPADAVQVVNAYAREAIALSAESQREELKQVTGFLAAKLSETDNTLKESSRKLINSGTATDFTNADASTLSFLHERTELEKKAEKIRFQLGTLDLQIDKLVQEIAQQHPTLVKAREDLDRALVRFTDEHPKIRELRAGIAAIRTQITQKATNGRADFIIPANSTASTLYVRVVDLQTGRIGLEKQLEEVLLTSRQLEEKLQTLPEAQVQYAAANADYKSLQARRELLAKYYGDAQFLLENASGWIRAFQWAREEYARSFEKLRTAAFAALFCGIIATLFSAMLVSVLELFDGRIRTQRDLERAARLPVLASLGDLNSMTEQQRDDWAFRTFTLLKAKMDRAGNRALICGLISAWPGEGRSTWIDLLAKAAHRRGNRVLVVSPPVHGSSPEGAQNMPGDSSALALEAPADLARQLVLPGSPSILQVTLPNSTWNWEWRQRWQDALQQWNRIENLVLLVDLPPASNPEAVLLSEQIPQLIWLCAKDKATTTETRTQMETLRCAKCELVGSVFNRAVIPAWRRRFAHLRSLVWLGWLLFGSVVNAQAPKPEELPTAITNAAAPSLSISSPDRLAEWQRKLTLGPGDVLTISIYDDPDSARTDMAIGPDGRINYLEAQDVMAAGLTVDELRAHLDEILGKIHREPRTVIIPTSYHSKKFFMLGNVMKKGPVPLDRPMTLVEAVARSGGFVSREGVILADFSRSFVIRKRADGTFAPFNVDFEGLFLRGDLMQNVSMSPEDYVFFLPADLPQVYVLGDGVISSGPLPYGQNMTVLKAITSLGGFAEKAYKRRVLVVRGSLSHPETFIVNTTEILEAKAVDFKLAPRDIVYVSRRPWAKVEELLELAVSYFARSVAVTWASGNVGPFITEPIF